MDDRLKKLILILVIGAAGFLLLRSYWPPSGDSAFSATDNPGAAIESALAAGEPLLIEFYADT